MNDLLLIAADLDERRLLYAELLEAGYDVLPLPSLSGVIRWLSRGLPMPTLILLDIGQAGESQAELLEQLLAQTPGVPLVLVVPATNRFVWQRFSPRLAALLQRPVSIGEIVDAVRRIQPPVATC